MTRFQRHQVGKYINTVLSLMVSVPPNMDISDFPICFLIEKYFHVALKES